MKQEIASRSHHAPVRVLPHIKKLDDCSGQFLVRVICDCGACREIQPQALARLVGWKMTLKELALRMPCSKCGRKAAHAAADALSQAGLTSLGSEPCRAQADHHGFPSRGSPVTISGWKSPCAKVAISRA